MRWSKRKESCSSADNEHTHALSSCAFGAQPLRCTLSKTWAYPNSAQLMNDAILNPCCVRYLENWRLRNTVLALSLTRKATTTATDITWSSWIVIPLPERWIYFSTELNATVVHPPPPRQNRTKRIKEALKEKTQRQRGLKLDGQMTQILFRLL